MCVNSHAALSGPSLGHLLAQSGIEQMHEPHSRLLQLLPDDLGVRVYLGGIDRHFPRRLVTGRATTGRKTALALIWPFQPPGARKFLRLSDLHGRHLVRYCGTTCRCKEVL